MLKQIFIVGKKSSGKSEALKIIKDTFSRRLKKLRIRVIEIKDASEVIFSDETLVIMMITPNKFRAELLNISPEELPVEREIGTINNSCDFYFRNDGSLRDLKEEIAEKLYLYMYPMSVRRTYRTIDGIEKDITFHFTVHALEQFEERYIKLSEALYKKGSSRLQDLGEISGDTILDKAKQSFKLASIMHPQKMNKGGQWVYFKRKQDHISNAIYFKSGLFTFVVVNNSILTCEISLENYREYNNT
jgi:hypothetical protein